ncbi:hypothetical protein P8452_00467 [Trifolium repens]|nr:hypothetical protein P8452_00467 [Trifolium repens]
MGRSVPYDNANNSLKGSFLYFSFSFLALATSIAIITTLCSSRFRRRKSPPPQPNLRTSSNPFDVTPTSDAKEEAATTTASANANATIFVSQEQPRTTETSTIENTTTEENNNEMLLKELPLPPAMQQSNNNNSEFVKRTTSERRLSFNLSMKMPRSLSLAKNWDKKEDKDKNLEIGKKEKLKADEGVWMKAIILGEKCVPDEEEDAVIYEGKGKKISAYHPRTSVSSTSKSLSRQWSSVALDVPQSHEERMNNI